MDTSAAAVAQLSSVATALDDLTARVVTAAEGFRGTPDDHVAADLDEVERALQSASRRLAATLRTLGASGYG